MIAERGEREGLWKMTAQPCAAVTASAADAAADADADAADAAAAADAGATATPCSHAAEDDLGAVEGSPRILC